MFRSKRGMLRYGGVGLIMMGVAFFAAPIIPASAWPNPDHEATVQTCEDGVGSRVDLKVINKESNYPGSPGSVVQASLVFDPPLLMPTPIFTPDSIPNTGDSFATATIVVPESYTGIGKFSYRMAWSGTDGSDMRPAASESPAKLQFNVTGCVVATTTTTEPETTTTSTTEPETTTTSTTEPETTTTSTTEPETTTTSTTEPETTTTSTTEPETTTTSTTEPETTTTSTTEPETTTTTEPESTTTTTEQVTTTTRKPCPPGTEVVGENWSSYICQPVTTTTTKTITPCEEPLDAPPDAPNVCQEPTTTVQPTCDDLTQEEAQMRLEAGDTSLDIDDDGVACSEVAILTPESVEQTLPVTGSNTLIPIAGACLLTLGLVFVAASRKAQP